MAIKPHKKKPPKKKRSQTNNPVEVSEEEFIGTDYSRGNRHREMFQQDESNNVDGRNEACSNPDEKTEKNNSKESPIATFSFEYDEETGPEWDKDDNPILYPTKWPDILQDCHGRYHTKKGLPALFWDKKDQFFYTSIGECWDIDGNRLPNSKKHIMSSSFETTNKQEGNEGNADVLYDSNEDIILDKTKNINKEGWGTDQEVPMVVKESESESPEIFTIVKDDGFQTEFVEFFKKINKIINNGSEAIVKQITIKESREDINIRILSPVQKSRFVYELLKELNGDNPQIFVNPQGDIVQIRQFGRENQIIIVVLKKADLQFIIIRRANFVTVNQSGDIKYTMLDVDSLNDVFATQDKHDLLPMLVSVKSHPFYDETGALHNAPGYNEETKTILDLPSDLELYEVDEVPSQESIEIAKKVIVGGLFAGFKFETLADMAHAVALFLLFFIRDLIKGPTPINIVESSEFGTGKTFLVECIIRAISGIAPEETTFPTSDSEFRRQLLAHLIKGVVYLFIDNLSHNQRLSSAELAQTSTSTIKSGRILGQSKIVDFVVKMIFIISGVNINIDRELLRRSIRIRLIKTDSYPNRDHLAWIRKNRPEILWAALTLIQAWISKGRPLADKSLRSFDRWAEIMGGILEVAGIEGFLENQETFMDGGDPEFDAYIALVTIWWKVYGGKRVLSRDLMGLIVNEGIAIPLEGRSNVNKAVSLGYLLRSLKDRQIGKYKIADAGLRSGSRLWSLIETV